MGEDLPRSQFPKDARSYGFWGPFLPEDGGISGFEDSWSTLPTTSSKVSEVSGLSISFFSEGAVASGCSQVFSSPANITLEGVFLNASPPRITQCSRFLEPFSGATVAPPSRVATLLELAAESRFSLLIFS